MRIFSGTRTRWATGGTNKSAVPQSLPAHLRDVPLPLGCLVRALSITDAGGTMSYQVIVKEVEARPTAVVPATTTWQEFPTLWRELSAEVWACLNAGGISRG